MSAARTPTLQRRSVLARCAALFLVFATGCTTDKRLASLSPRLPFTGERPVLARADGCAVYYSRSLHGGRTADGGRLDNTKLTAAHRSYPFGTIIRVTRVKNGKSVEVRITDRLPSTRTNNRLGIIIDLTRAAASKLDMLRDGRVKVKVEVLEWGTRKQKGKRMAR
jgi:rare lipoprotein A